jgi:hypothetical protein
MAKDKSRNYSMQTIKRLYGLSGNKCFFLVVMLNYSQTIQST